MRLITDDDLVKLFHYLARAEREELEHPTIMLAVRLQFEFAARMSEIINLQWDWIDLAKRRVAWPDSKTGGVSKPMSQEAHRLLKSARRLAMRASRWETTGSGTGRRRILPTRGCR